MKLIIQTIREYEIKIDELKWDDESAHELEDEARDFFIQNCLFINEDEIKEAQEIFKRIANLNFNRWCA